MNKGNDKIIEMTKMVTKNLNKVSISEMPKYLSSNKEKYLNWIEI